MKIDDIRKATSKKRVARGAKRERDDSKTEQPRNKTKEKQKSFSENTNQIFNKTRTHDNVYFFIFI